MSLTKIPQDTLDALESKHKAILVMNGDEEMSPWTVALRRATRQESIGYKQAQQKDKTTAAEALIKRLIVHPSTPSEVEALLEEWPFMCDGIIGDSTFEKFVGIAASAQRK